MSSVIQDNQFLFHKLTELSTLQQKKQLPKQLLITCHNIEHLANFAKSVAKMILCFSSSYLDDCICLNCQKVDNESYYDLTILGNFIETIKKEAILDLIQKNSLTSLESKVNKIYIIQEINNLTIEGANALLKFLEEPPENTYAILLTKNINQVLSTIKSRCLTIKLNSSYFFASENNNFHPAAITYVRNWKEEPQANYFWLNDIKKIEKKEKKIILKDIINILHNQKNLIKKTVTTITATIDLLTKIDENFNEELMWQNYVILSNGD